ncbi:methionine ABC transporter ATP-binding protein [Lentilactobacillus farraginis]|uniref:Methionine ABC superfamily ATP binding cassette transporter, ABC protein n=1 Tax=Lentilactobacillus farraginis DSM 18382 = JCM 14108 TaxID=1423743 RepID=X0PMI1_9LACO|nr:ATP-binding cassette domain-containing protein [Lentilactobacillus farraginis]KRM03290.1 methionine ABC superfamily ATP binding cassette transporter, ABC protein [Lentilactobacillus farraginis DSM 18382 = JCM 14108]GAF38046.1 methionine ABC transporter ATP-binding protein [Lentilactobacillus farraginis DSM 18382 = JCM 14108]
MVKKDNLELIKFKNVTKTFAAVGNAKEVHAVKNVSLSVQKGEIFGVIGYSGAGKSTLIRMINGLERPTSGEIIVSGEDVAKLSKKRLQQLRHKIGMIFQNYNLLKTATVYQNIFLPLKLEKLPVNDIRERVEKYLKIVGLWERRNSYPTQLSGGQRQRVAVARALAHEPEILLSDEATSALDPETTKSILRLLQKINTELGITIFLITHELDVVQEICDKVALIDKGNLIEQGKTIDLFTHPQKTITQKFLGTSDSLGVPIDYLKAEQKTKKLLLLQFVGNEASQPIIADFSQHFGIKPNILAGSINYLKGNPYGKLLLSIKSVDDVYSQELKYIRDQGVIVKEVTDL